MAKILGIGGIFFKSKEPAKLAEWYKKWLKLKIQDWGGCSFSKNDLPENGYSIWSPFLAESNYFDPSKSNFMINFIVDDLEEALKQVKQGGAELIGVPEDSEFSNFGWFIDPDGNKIELWVPKK
jgi:predicted enzyme related to lactoylglutathione lyase